MLNPHLLLIFLTIPSLSSHAQEKYPFTHESEASIVTVSGNTQTESYSAKQTSEYKFGKELLNAKARYLRTKNFSTETARQWEASLRYEREFSMFWSHFLQQGSESDPYAGFTQRDNSDIGLKYFFIKIIPELFFLEIGYRYSKTLSSLNTDTLYKNSGRLYIEYNNKLNETVSLKFWLEYLPDLKDTKDFLVNYEPSLTILMSQTFSLKLSYLIKYHNKIVIAEEKKEDTTFTTALVAKF